MAAASSAILSIAVLASFALALGGGYLLAKRRERVRGVLMLVAAAVLLGNVLIWAWPASARKPLPREVRAFIERRESCEHWLGEEPYDAERRAEINRAVRSDCPGNEARLTRLRRKYARSADVLRALAGPPLD